jgi:hypothetical protein
MERELRFGIQGLPRPRHPMPVELARVLWLLPAVRWLCLFALVVSVFLVGLVTGVGLESTRHRVEVTPAAVAAGYREGFDQGLAEGLGRRAAHVRPQACLPQE